MSANAHETALGGIHELSGVALVHRLFDYLETHGQTRYDEQVTQFEHAVQSAMGARERGYDAELVTAALFHDIGHLVLDEHDGRDDFLVEDRRHDHVGANFLARWFTKPVTEAVRLHVVAKRYLCAVDPSYYQRLSNATKRSLVIQGGPLDVAERSLLDATPHFDRALQVRRLDDRGKVGAMPIVPIREFTDVTMACLALAPND